MVQEQRSGEEIADPGTSEAPAILAAIAERRQWLTGHLSRAAEHFGVRLVGGVVTTYDLRSAGSRALAGSDTVWVRVVLDDPDYQPACQWDGNLTANTIVGVPKPRVLRWVDWIDDSTYRSGGSRLRGELMSLIRSAAISGEDGLLHDDPGLPDSWWLDLKNALMALAAHPAPEIDPVDIVGYTVRGTHYHFDIELDPGMVANQISWVTVHGDLHWGNLTQPELFILDWETWRRGPAGYDVATLYCDSLLHPPTAERLRQRFATVLDTPSGQFSLLSAACRYLWLAEENGDFQVIGDALREVGLAALDQLTAQSPDGLSRAR